MLYTLCIYRHECYHSEIRAYDDSLRASKRREQELKEKLDAYRDSQEKDQKCSKLEDDMYDMQKKLAASRDDYELQQKSK